MNYKILYVKEPNGMWREVCAASSEFIIKIAALIKQQYREKYGSCVVRIRPLDLKNNLR